MGFGRACDGAANRSATARGKVRGRACGSIEWDYRGIGALRANQAAAPHPAGRPPPDTLLGGRHAEAELLLREASAIRQETIPNH